MLTTKQYGFSKRNRSESRTNPNARIWRYLLFLSTQSRIGTSKKYQRCQTILYGNGARRKRKRTRTKTTEEPPKYPKEILQQLSETENFIPLTRDTQLINYQNAQVILIGAREGHDIIKKEMGIEINYDKNQTAESSSADTFKKLKVHKEQVPIRPLTEGKLE